MRQYETFELSFEGQVPEHDTCAPDLTVTFTHDGTKTAVRGFYDGDGIYRARFLPEETGSYQWKAEGIVQAEGTEDCRPADEKHHGRVIAEGTHFRYEDGSRYLPFGTTVYALAHQEDALVDQTIGTLSGAPFNKVRMCVFPKHYLFNTNEPPVYPFEKTEDGSWDVNRPSLAFWHRFEKILDRLEALKIEVDLILFHPYDRWGFSKLGMEQNLVYLENVIRRLAARPNIWWSMANEYDLMPQYQIGDWYAIEEYIAAHDPFHHLLSNHSCMIFYDYGRPNITHCCLQTQWVEKADEWQRFGKPVIYDEMCYEGNITMNWGNISAFEMVNRFWCVCAKGAYGTHGETFLSPDNILWWAAGGKLKGESPKRIAWLKDILYSLPGTLEPVSDRSFGIPAELREHPEKLEEFLAKLPPEGQLFGRLILGMNETDRNLFMVKNASFAGHCGEDACLTYFARTCPGVTTVKLPDHGTYRIDVLDVWDMTRTTAAEHASGDTEITLPGREGMAVLAVRE